MCSEAVTRAEREAGVSVGSQPLAQSPQGAYRQPSEAGAVLAYELHRISVLDSSKASGYADCWPQR